MGRKKNKLNSLCQKGSDGKVIKSNITVENFKELKNEIKNLDISVVNTSDKSFSYRQYCKLYDSYTFKNKKCNDKVCCQAITADGSRCTRAATKFVTVDLTEKDLTPNIPTFLKKKIGYQRVEELKMIGFANSCCFYCWQHASAFVLEKSTYATNLLYYSTHPEDILKIFFEDVSIKKYGGVIPYKIERVSGMRNVSEIIRMMYKTSGDMEGALSSYYWVVFLMVFAYDNLRDVIISSSNLKEKDVKEMAVKSADVLLQHSK